MIYHSVKSANGIKNKKYFNKTQGPDVQYRTIQNMNKKLQKKLITIYDIKYW